jgi:glutathione peroxidase
VLEALHRRYAGRGLRVLGFPCNDFAAEEPDDLDTIKAFCAREYGVSYELFDKVHAKGPEIHPLYRWLTLAGDSPGPVTWNFEKFLVDRTGQLAGRWAPRVRPDDPRVVAAIEAALERPVEAVPVQGTP